MGNAGMESLNDSVHRMYMEHRRQLVTFALSITGERRDAEDAVHEAIMRILNRGRHPRDLKPYLFRSVRNAAHDIRRRAARQTYELFDLPHQLESSRNGVFQYRQLEAGLRHLSDRERETIMLKIYEEMTFQEIADLRHVSINTVSSWYRRGLVKLKQHMQRNGHG